MRSICRSAGFSLIELMMVLVLVAIFASIAVPSFNALIERNRIQTASEELYSLLQYARSEAVNRHANVSIRAKGLEIISGATTVQKHQGFQQVSLSASSATAELTFNATGTLSNQAANIDIKVCFAGDKSTGRLLTVQPSGRVILYPSSKQPDSCN